MLLSTGLRHRVCPPSHGAYVCTNGAQPCGPANPGGRYQLRSRIGQGGTGRVYVALDHRLGRIVAVKLLDRDRASDPAWVARSRREAQVTAVFNHRNVVTVYDWGAEEGDYYSVMEYVPGPNLREVLLQQGLLAETRALTIAVQVASALAAAHAQNIVHRDVKPHNVLLDPQGVAKVADFGVARAGGVGQTTTSSMVMGTAPSYSRSSTNSFSVPFRVATAYKRLTRPLPGGRRQAACERLLRKKVVADGTEAREHALTDGMRRPEPRLLLVCEVAVLLWALHFDQRL